MTAPATVLISATTTRAILWIEQAIGDAVRWRQEKAASDGQEAIEQSDDRRSDVTVDATEIVQVPSIATETVQIAADDLGPARTAPAFEVVYEDVEQKVPRWKYSPAVRAALTAAAQPVFDKLVLIYGQKWPITWFHFDAASELLQFRRKRSIDGMEDAPTTECQDPRAIAAARAAVATLAQLLTEAHGHPIAAAEPTPLPEPESAPA